MKIADLYDLLPPSAAGKIQATDSGCWEWVGHQQDRGYGRLRYKGKLRSTHRLTYMVVNGPIPDGWTIDHLCNNRSCLHPAHLDACSQSENSSRHWASDSNRNVRRMTLGGCSGNPEPWQECSKWMCAACLRHYVSLVMENQRLRGELERGRGIVNSLARSSSEDVDTRTDCRTREDAE